MAWMRNVIAIPRPFREVCSIINKPLDHCSPGGRGVVLLKHSMSSVGAMEWLGNTPPRPLPKNRRARSQQHGNFRFTDPSALGEGRGARREVMQTSRLLINEAFWGQFLFFFPP
ncbi:hypothetical protein D8B26_000076 [Coccidioides posadasii str. Silveira]|uniref:uncharacterized protein n=1 Tax=Coccidioides posadasii (strain RMSCC 757 / Silveira) TaxID=443226 RepID=UPI001BEEEC1A|nr:hypothetical protein D8B26_000076 [Coccidioides posadasii str. Silveira]